MTTGILRLRLAVLALLAAGAGGARRHQQHVHLSSGRQSERSGSSRGSPGQVDGVYAFGSPGSATPPLVNTAKNNSCFPGLRMWTAKSRFYGWDMDFATTVTGAMGYRHPLMAGLQAVVNKDTVEYMPCSDILPNRPRGPPTVLHALDLYVEMANKLGDELVTNVSSIAVATSQMPDDEEARKVVEQHGWELAASAYHDGNLLVGGPQHTHLIQQPETKECMMTFQGTSSFNDWVSNLDSAKAHFCGLVGEDERCLSTGQCSSKSPGGSFVHRGFRDHLRRIVKSDSWQQEIRPLLPSCSKVYVAGHSLGGAMAELFAACVAKAPQPGEYGYEEDYQYFGWTRAA